MSDADDAYEAARRIIAKALVRRIDVINALDLSTKETVTLTTLPPKIADLTRIKKIYLHNTQVTDLTPIAGLTGLTDIYLESTPVTDLTPLAGLTNLTTLALGYTPITDLTPLAGLTSLTSLSFSQTPITDLTPLEGMTGLTSLVFFDTQVVDLIPIKGLTGLTTLSIGNTEITDLVPITGLTGLTSLYLNNSLVDDLRPLLALAKLADAPFAKGLTFRNTPATKLDPKLAELSEIEDDEERTTKTFAYLREVGEDWPPLPVTAPDQDTILTITQTNDGRLDISPATPDAEELTDAVKAKAHALLQQATKSLEQIAGNMHPRLAATARTLSLHIDCPLQDVDMLDVHFELEALRGTYERRGERKGEDIFGDDVIDALDKVLMIGPGLVLDNEQVEKLEARRDRYRGHVPDADTLAAQDEMSDGIIDHPEVFGDHLRAYSEGFKAGSKQEMDRLRTGQNSANKNVVIVAGMYVVDGMVGGPLSAAGESIFTWLIAQSETISILAPTWGSAFEAWITPILMRAKEARSGVQGALKRPN